MPGASPHTAAVATGAAAGGEDHWSVVDAPAPATPDGYRPIVETVLQCTPQELYGILFSSSGTELYLQQHRECGGHRDLAATPWRRAAAAAGPGAGVGGGGGASGESGPGAAAGDGSLLGPLSVFEYVAGQPGSGGFTRCLTFVNPKKPPNTNDTRCVQRQQLVAYRGDVLVFATAMNMLDIPFRDCFTVNTFWRVSPGAAPGTCAVCVTLRVQFLKRAMGVGGIISATTSRETTAFFSAFLSNVERRLAELRQQAGGARGSPQMAGASRTALQSPFAAAAGAATAAGPSHDGRSGAVTTSPPLRHTWPLWKQLRAVLVFCLLAWMLVHQLHLGAQIDQLRGGGAAGAAAAGGGGGDAGTPGGVVSLAVAHAAGLLAAALEPVAAAAGGAQAGLQAVVDRLGTVARGGGDGRGGAGAPAVAAEQGL